MSDSRHASKQTEASGQEQQPVVQSLYQAREKLHVRLISGWFTSWRWALVWITQIIFFVLPWLTWNDRQAVLFHLTERRFYIFDWVFWPQDVIYLTLILIISAYALFFFTAIAGRLWCGYACPQTVYTEIFMWIEEKIEGDHLKRKKLEAAPLSGKKLMLRTLKYGAWIVFSLWTGFTFVAYFSPLQELLAEARTFSFGPWELFWMLFYAGFTYLFAGVMREQVCKYMCPYARFQSVMFDPDTLVVTYDEARGEPRGSRKKGIDPRSVDKGDCVDCGICVQVCPTGIDIRNGLQYECIGCGACIDGCNQVMERMNYPKGLIRYTTENAVRKQWGQKEILAHVARPRTLIYGFILVLVCVGMAASLALRENLRVDILRDRAALAREVDDGMIENVYRLQIINMVEFPRQVRISVSGIDGIQIYGQESVLVPASDTYSATVQVRVPPMAGQRGAKEIEFELIAEREGGSDDPTRITEKSTFLMPL